MKKLAVMTVMVVLCLVGFSARANDRAAASSQLQIFADYPFWPNEDETLSGYGAGYFTLTLNNGYSNLQGYVGARISIDKLSIYLLGVTNNDYEGWSVGPSMWLEFNGENNYFFAQYDFNCPFMSSMSKDDPRLMGEDPPLPLHTYYLYAEYMRTLPSDTGIGFTLEAFGDYKTVDPEEFAYGPFWQMGKLRISGLYDVTPQTDGYEYWVLRIGIFL